MATEHIARTSSEELDVGPCFGGGEVGGEEGAVVCDGAVGAGDVGSGGGGEVDAGVSGRDSGGVGVVVGWGRLGLRAGCLAGQHASEGRDEELAAFDA